MFPVPVPSGVRAASLPTRTVSLASTQAATFTAIEDELRDVKRVHSQGQEEDLRMALSRTIGRVEELSNLSLALANNEMLEDALKRDGGNSKDVGWRRMSAKEQRERELAADSRRQSTDSIGSAEVVPSPILNSPNPPPTAEPRFFKFRFGSSTPGTQSPRMSGSMSPIPSASTHASHLTSASLPSLVPVKDRDKEVEDLTLQLELEKEKHKAAQAAKEALEAELESLSQALFEEANKMVASERMKLAETEEELKEAQAEKEALRSALRLVEHQREAASSREASVEPPEHRSRPVFYMHSHKRSSSSAIAIKSTPSSPQSVIHVLEDDIQASRAAVPPPLDLPEVGLANPDVKPSPSEQPSASSSETSSLAPPSSDDSSKSSSPTPSPGHYAFKTSNSVSYFDGEESPWADVRSATPISAAF